MAKKTRRLLTMCLALIFCISIIASPAMAFGWGGGWGPNPDYSDQYEWYEVYVQGNLIASGQSEGGDMYYLGTHYTADITADGPIVSWYIITHGGYGNEFSGTADLRDYITIPEGFTVKDYEITSSSVDGVNSAAGSAYFDNAIISITINTIYNEETGEEIEVPTTSSVTVNHTYYTYDSYTGLTTEDGSSSDSDTAEVGQEYTATAATSYNGNEYAVNEVSPAMTIEVAEDASANIINISYLRSIDTTPIPVETEVTVNHLYYTYDEYTEQTTLDGEASGTEAATEGQFYTAVAVPSYNNNSYIQQTADAALTIAVAADASANVINIEYLRTINTAPINYSPVLSVEKTADKAVYEAGEDIQWTITVTNISGDTAYDISIIDELTGDNWNIDALAPGASKSFSATTENAAAGSIQNVAVVSWDDGDEIFSDDEPDEVKTTSDDEIVTVSDPEPENYIPVLDIEKTAEKKVYKEGETVSWTITVKNIGQFAAQEVIVVDELAGGRWLLGTMEPGAVETISVTMENVAVGTLKNIAVVTWDDGDDIPTNDEPNEVKTTSDEEIVTVEENENFQPVLDIIKTADKEVYEIGETITWTITVKNIGEYPAHYINVVDEVTGDEWNIPVLAPGAEQSFTVLMETEAEGTMTNIATVHWNDGDDIPDEEEIGEPKEDITEKTVTVEEPQPPAPPAQDDESGEEYIPEEYIPEVVSYDDGGIEIPDEEVPLAEVPDEVEIPDEEVPLADAPETGDISFLWAAMSALSAGGIVAVNTKKSKKEEKE